MYLRLSKTYEAFCAIWLWLGAGLGGFNIDVSSSSIRKFIYQQSRMKMSSSVHLTIWDWSSWQNTCNLMTALSFTAALPLKSVLAPQIALWILFYYFYLQSKFLPTGRSVQRHLAQRSLQWLLWYAYESLNAHLAGDYFILQAFLICYFGTGLQMAREKICRRCKKTWLHD